MITYVETVAIVTSIVGSARLIVKVLPNPNADTKFEAIVDILKHIGLVVTPPSDVIAPVPAGAVPAPIVVPTTK